MKKIIERNGIYYEENKDIRYTGKYIYYYNNLLFWNLKKNMKQTI